MRKYLIIFAIVVLFQSLPIYTQDTLNAAYYKNLVEILIIDQNVKKTKLIQKYLANGEYFKQELYVKYKDDPLNRFWRIGRDFGYDAKNKNLVFTSYVDIKSKILSDTSFSYDENGKISMLIIYNTNSNRIIPVKIKFSFFSIFRKYYENTPSQFKIIMFHNSKKTYEEQYCYFDNKGFLKDGEMTYYKEDGTMDKVVKYEMGKEVTPVK
jgi:hypothetical protein